MIRKAAGIFLILLLTSFVIRGQSLFESSDQDTTRKKSAGDRIELGGYTRGVLYLGENNNKAEVSSGYGEAALKLRFIPDKSVRVFTELRLRGGYEYGSKIIRPELREFYADVSLGKFDIRLGHQIVAWGRADGINPTDNLTPKNYFIRSPEPDDIRLANYLFMVKYRLTENIRLEGEWVPFYRYSLYRFDLFDMPGFVTIKNPGNPEWENSGGNTGLKAEFLFPVIDGSVSWFSGFDPQPGIDILSLSMSMSGLSLDLGAKAFRHNTIGIDFAAQAGSFGIRGEAALRIPTSKYQDEIYTPDTDLRYVFGVDRSFGNFNFMIQYIGQWVPGFTDMPELMLFNDSGGFILPDTSMYNLIPDILKEQIHGFNRLIYGQTHRVSHTISGRPSIAMLHSTLNAEVFCMYNLSTEELMVMPKISYNISDNWKISVGGQYFSGPENTLNNMVGPVFNSGFLELKWSF
jgi:hypothetical protein